MSEQEKKEIEIGSTVVPLEIKLGVTGHRNISVTPELLEAIRLSLTETIEQIIMPSGKEITTPITYRIITPLADGTDRIVARESMEILNAKMMVTLPMMKEEYIPTFFPGNSSIEFESYLNSATEIKTLIEQPLLNYYQGLELEECKHLAFQQVGRYVADNCDILIAVWNGTNSREKGGTAEIINYARSIRKTLIIISSDNPHSISVEKGNGFISDCLDRFEFFNSYNIPSSERVDYISNFLSEVFNNPEGNKLSNKIYDIIKEKLLPHYVQSSIISKRYQRIHQLSGLAVYLLAPLAVASVAFGILFHHFALLFFSLEFLILLSIISIVSFSERISAHKNWLHYRFIVEKIRTAIFFISCGEKPNANQNSLVPRVSRSNDVWMNRLVDEILNKIILVSVYQETDYSMLLNFIRKHWIIDQMNFHKNKWIVSRSKSHKYEKYGEYIFILALIASAVHIILGVIGAETKFKWIVDNMTLMAILLPAVGASIVSIRNQREYSRIADKSEKAYFQLSEILEDSASVRSMQELKMLLLKIETHIQRESDDWFSLMKFVKVEAI